MDAVLYHRSGEKMGYDQQLPKLTPRHALIEQRILSYFAESLQYTQ
jgi:hypothetical protein